MSISLSYYCSIINIFLQPATHATLLYYRYNKEEWVANIVIVTGGVRQVNVNAGIVDIIAAEVNGRDGLTAQVADLGALNLPFFNAPTSPSAEEYTITD